MSRTPVFPGRREIVPLEQQASQFRRPPERAPSFPGQREILVSTIPRVPNQGRLRAEPQQLPGPGRLVTPANIFPELEGAWVASRQDVRNRNTLNVNMRRAPPNADLQQTLFQRALAVGEIAVQAFQPGMILSVVIYHLDRLRVVRRPGNEPRPMYLRGRFASVQEIEESLPLQILETLAGIMTSAGEVNLENLNISLQYDRPVEARAGKMPCYVRRSMNETVRGLDDFEATDGLCAFEAIVMQMLRRKELRQLWTGDMAWFRAFPPDKALKKLKWEERTLTWNAREMMKRLGMENWMMVDGAENGSNRFVLAQPKFQILVYSATKQLMFRHAGIQCTPTEDCTIFLYSTFGHIQSVQSIRQFLGFKGRGTFCGQCAKFKETRHLCIEADYQCQHCFLYFKSAAELRNHNKRDRNMQFKCICDKEFPNEDCFNAHKCMHSRKFGRCPRCTRFIKNDQHNCNDFHCTGCRKMVPLGHRCAFTRDDPPKQQTAAAAGKNYYAFDIESMFIPQPDGSDLHQINLIVMKKCFSAEPPIVFKTAKEFVVWIEQLEECVTLFAHNLKGYDGRMIFDFLFDNNRTPSTMMWRGSKIMKMEYGKAKFMDTLLHFPSALAALPGIFGMDETQFKKGFFPYKFNIAENQQYMGPIPDESFFDPDSMSPKKRGEFIEWYAEERMKLYDFYKELVDYCISDVLILTKSIELYMERQMTQYPLDPFSCTTSASYAMKMYKTYYMPENQIYVLHKDEHDNIAKSMHGGRTDVRRLLKEWSEEEVAAGKYGKYQDVQSLYPTVQFYDDMPVGVPRMKVFLANDPQPSPEEIYNVFGFVCCDIEPTRYLHHPVIVELVDGKLLAHLNPMKKQTIATPELKLALDNGYVVTKVYYWYEFDRSRDLFRTYFQDFLKAKIHASGMPGWVQSEQDWQEFYQKHREMGVELDRGKMVKNPGAKIGAKLLLNSLWGKFGENSTYFKYDEIEIVKDHAKYMGIENRWFAGEIDIHHRKVSASGERMYMIYTSNEDHEGKSNIYQKNTLARKNIAIASFVTSHARCRLWAEMNKLGKRVLYHDTDSIIYEHQLASYNIPEGRYLGEWEDECKGNPITAFVSTGPKCYTIVQKNPDGTFDGQSKVKGVTLNYANQQKINYDSMKQLVTGQLNKIITTGVLFKYSLTNNRMVTSMIDKVYRQTYDKGFIGAGFRVYPKGFEKFEEAPE